MSTSRLLIGGLLAATLIGVGATLKRPAASTPSMLSIGDGQASVQAAIAPTYSTPSPTPLTTPPPPPISQTQTLPSYAITTCNGAISSANFRAQPSLYGTIVGVVPYGDWVQLTGNVAQGDGLLWHEAIAPSLGNSKGWVAGCFIQ